MRLRVYTPLKRARWALVGLLFVVSQFGPLTMLANTAQAATFELASSSGKWTAVSGGSNINGINTNEVRWGTTNGQQSGLKFNGSGIQGFEAGDKINLGKLTHFNFPINNAANGATLAITLVFTSPSVSPDPSFSFQFDIDETSNDWNCPNWHTDGFPHCDDKITFPNSFPSQSFTIGDKLYTLKIEGFSSTSNGANPISQFITHEEQSNDAYLIGSLSSVLVSRPHLTLVKKTVNGEDANVAPGPSVYAGSTVTFDYYVQNTGNTTLTNVAIDDNKGVVATCQKTTLLAGESTKCTGTQTAVAGQYTNVAFAKAKNGQDNITSNTDPANYFGLPKPGNLIVKKTVQNPNGGILGASAFNVHVKSGNTDVNGSPAVGSVAGTNYSLAPGTYTVSEDNPSSLGYEQVSITCEGQSTATVTVTSDTTKTCEIINKDIAPTITLVKAFTGNRYGDTTSANNFGLTIGGNAATSGQAYSVKSNETYALNEAGSAGYQFSSITGSQKCPTTLNGKTAALNPGEKITCTIKNEAIAPSLTIKKIAQNDNGGTTTSDKFNLYTTYNGTKTKLIGGTNNTNGTTTTTTYVAPVPAIGNYTLSEDEVSGYTAGNWSCTGNSIPLNGTTVTVKLGENVKCEITNNDDTTALTLVKKLGATYGSNANVSDWVLNATGTVANPTNLSGATGTAGATSGANFKADTYTLSETGPSGFTSSWSCKNNITNVETVVPAALAISLGQSFTCTVTNTGIQPKLTVTKIVTNDNGGTKQVADFPLFVGATSVTSGVKNGFNVGTYTVSETSDPGYSSVIGGNCSVNGSVTLALADDKACTITNNDIAPTLTLVKKAINDNGGTKLAGSFTLTAAGQNFTGGTNTTVGNTTTSSGYAVANIKAGAANKVTVSEQSTPGYSVTSIVCKDGTGATIASNINQSSLDVTLGLAQNVTCTVTNDDNTATLTLIKSLVNNYGGPATPASWTLTATGPTTFSGTTGVSSNVNAGQYTLSESSNLSGFTQSAWQCANAGTLSNGLLLLGLGSSDSCTITNTAIQPRIKVIKHVVDQFNGTKVAGDFTMNVTGTDVTLTPGNTGLASSQSFAGSESGTYVYMDAGAFSVGETELPGYAKSMSGDCSGTVSIGDTNKVCTITNTAIQPKLTVTKVVVNDNGGTKTVSDFPLFVDTTSVTSGVQNGFNAGMYTVSETSDSGYSSVISGDCAKDGSITLALGNTKACTITNTAIAPTLTLKKNVINNNSGESESSDWTLTATPEENNYGATIISGNGDDGVDQVAAKANVTYTLTEDGPTDYTAGTWWCNGGSLDGNKLVLAPGQNVECWITNNDNQHPGIVVYKYGPNTAYEGDTVTYSFWVYNSGDTYLDNLSVIDDIAGTADCSSVTSLYPGDWAYCTVTYTIPTPQVANVDNTVTACGDYYSDNWNIDKISTDKEEQEMKQVCATDTHTLDVLHPAIKVVKSGPSTAKVGDKVSYTFTVTNIGDTPLDGITVSDNIAGSGTYQSGDVNNNQILEATETWVYTAQYTIPSGSEGKQVTNTVQACGTSLLQTEEESFGDNLRLLSINESSQDPTAPQACDDDSHTLTVASPQLVNTGAGHMPLVSIIVASLMFGGIYLAIRPRRHANR